MINPILIFGFKLGVTGSALSTIVVQAVCSLWIFIYFTKGKSLLKLKKVNIKLKRYIINDILAIGIAPFDMQIAASIVTIFINTSLVKYGGDLAIGAFSLINSIAILIIMPMLGVNQGAQPIIGYSYGAKNTERVKKALFYSAGVNAVIATIAVVIVQLFPVQIIKIFNTTDTQLIVILPHFFKLNGIRMEGATSDLISSAITFILIAREVKILNELKNEISEEAEVEYAI